MSMPNKNVKNAKLWKNAETSNRKKHFDLNKEQFSLN